MTDLAERLRDHVTAFTQDDEVLAPLLRCIGTARYVLIGEATHGTAEFYALRAELTKRLITEHGFSMVAVEADWPDAYRVSRYVRAQSRDTDAHEALSGFARFPRWMWRNQAVLEFVQWLRRHNDGAAAQVSFHGIDLYSLHDSMHSVLPYLDREDPQCAREARKPYGCFGPFGDHPQRYGYLTSCVCPSCEKAVVAQLVQLHTRRAELLAAGAVDAADELFVAEQNARVVKNAEQYYRAMYRGGVSSWNLRDTHMADTIDALCAHFGPRDPSTAKIVVWAHNSHLGDARATEMGRRGELNLGQLMRERHPGETFSVGFSTYDGEVTAASSWDAPPERKRVVPALTDSHEALFHSLGMPRFLLRCDAATRALLREPMLERAIGVVYRPETERASHYFHALIAEQFDALIHIDRTGALVPLDGHDREASEELPDTYPSGL